MDVSVSLTYGRLSITYLVNRSADANSNRWMYLMEEGGHILVRDVPFFFPLEVVHHNWRANNSVNQIRMLKRLQTGRYTPVVFLFFTAMRHFLTYSLNTELSITEISVFKHISVRRFTHFSDS